MRKYLLASAALMLGAAVASGPAKADVFTFTDVDYDKDVFVLEFITKFVNVDVDISQDFVGGSGAEATAVNNQRIDANVLTFDQSSGAFATTLQATIFNSIRGNVGITQTNQDNGHLSNQANKLVAAVARNDGFYTEANNSVEQTINVNQAFQTGRIISSSPPAVLTIRAALIQDSIVGNRGVTQTNQNAGALSNQLNSATLALGIGAAVALAEADLGQQSTLNFAFDLNTNKVATIVNSINDNRGITSTNQNVGTFNNQATVISFSGSIATTAANTAIPTSSIASP